MSCKTPYVVVCLWIEDVTKVQIFRHQNEIIMQIRNNKTHTCNRSNIVIGYVSVYLPTKEMSAAMQYSRKQVTLTIKVTWLSMEHRDIE